ncbi:MAG: FAD-dependent oxidoreductase [Gammaproteobacteria bacterium]|nr:FAD-dependent oxidoreductase [Gammaproteobacteria bacterium]
MSTSRTIVCGAGVIGASIAYHLALRGVAATVIERGGVACAASGKAGGFLARDWCDGSPLGPLARTSFRMHAELARRIDSDYGYRAMTTFAVIARGVGAMHADNTRVGAEWLDGDCAVHTRLGGADSTAQVHPRRFTHALMDAARSMGAQLVDGRVEGVSVAGSPPRVRGVRVDGAVMPADSVIIAMGPWSTAAAVGLPLPEVGGLKGFSITLAPAPGSDPLPAHALFADCDDGHGGYFAPEVFARPDGEVYLCGLSDDRPLPEDPGDIHGDAGATRTLRKFAARLSTRLEDARVTSENACYRPIFPDALPVMGEVPGVAGAYVATGHNCWGILNAPASGAAIAELVVEGVSSSVDLRPFSALRLAASAHARN